uniref:AAA+ ATPase domain-containing protein n=1 Tax=Trypanosoma congolense (strain IL3000) TaxID=1068625 RepID=G0UNT3_TRYCI|nr:conserved hypothetical protein [Trypanosoma congolense IL3000]
MFFGCYRMASLRSFNTRQLNTGVFFHCRRQMRLRQGKCGSTCLHLTNGTMCLRSSERTPPTGMPLAYLQQQITGMDKYRTADDVWSKGTLQDAWTTFNTSLQNLASSGKVLEVSEMVKRDLVGLALCTSYAEVKHLLSMLSPSVRTFLTSNPIFNDMEVEEFFFHLGQDIEVRGGDWVIQAPPPTVGDLRYTLERVGRFGEDGRGCIRNTSHRVAVWRGRHGEPLGLTIRVGRYVPNLARAIVPLARRGSVLIVSKAGVGKTTILRDLAASLSREPSRPRVMVIDTSNEIGGDSPVALPFLGRCRRVQVPRREAQQEVMRQVLQNHSPEYMIVDEITSAAEAEAAWSISQRGVHLIATCHGENLAGLLQNRSLNILVGGVAQAFLSNEERRLRNKVKKTVLERPNSSPFHFVVELTSRKCAHLYVDVNEAVDCLLDEQDARSNAQIGRTVAIDETLPDDVMALVISKGVAPSKLAGKGAWDSAEQRVGIHCVDEEGVYNTCGEREVAAFSAKQKRGSHSRGSNRRKADERLLEDISRLL